MKAWGQYNDDSSIIRYHMTSFIVLPNVNLNNVPFRLKGTQVFAETFKAFSSGRMQSYTIHSYFYLVWVSLVDDFYQDYFVCYSFRHTFYYLWKSFYSRGN